MDGWIRKTKESTVLVGDSNTLLPEMDRSSRQILSEYIVILNSTTNQLNIIHIYRLAHSVTAYYTFYSRLHETFTKTDYTLCRKMYLYLKKNYIMSALRQWN